jgi:hypothetical protein
LGSVDFEAKRTDQGDCFIWPERGTLDRLDGCASRGRTTARSSSAWPGSSPRAPDGSAAVDRAINNWGVADAHKLGGLNCETTASHRPA